VVSFKVFYAALAGVLTAVTGLLAVLLHASVAATAVVIVVLAGLALLISTHGVRRSKPCENWSKDVQRAALWWIGGAVAAYAATTMVLVVTSAGWWLQWLALVCVVVATQIGVSHLLHLHWFRLRRATPAVTPAPVDAPSAEVMVRPVGEVEPDRVRTLARTRDWADLSHDEQVMMAALASAGLGWLVMVGGEPIRDAARVFGVAFQVRVPASRLATDGANKAVVPPDAAEPIAIALSEQIGVQLESRFVGVRKLPAAGLYSITTVIEDVMGRLYPYHDPRVQQQISRPAVCGYGIDTKPVQLLLTQHGQHIGKTRSGKTSLIHTLLAFMTACAGNDFELDNCVIWICGTEKLYDLVAAWLEVYLGTDFDPPFDWVARGPEDTLAMMISLMNVARYRQAVSMSQRRWPTIICIMDEASFALKNKMVLDVYDGQPVTMSDMGGNIGQGAGSANCFLHYATQRDTNDQLGDRGGDIAAQTGFTTAFKISDQATIGRLMGDYRLPMPHQKGEFWLNGGGEEGEEGPQLVKAPYIQEVDPTKRRLHDGLTIADVSWSRRHFRRPLDAESARAAGPAYAHRHQRVTPEFLAYTGGNSVASMSESTMRRPEPLNVVEVLEAARVGGVDVAGMSPFEQRGFVEAIANEFGSLIEFRRFLADPAGYTVGGEQPVEDAVPADAVQDAVPVSPRTAAPVVLDPSGARTNWTGDGERPSPATVAQGRPGATKPTRTEAILAILDAMTVPMRSAELIAALRGCGDAVDNDIAVYNLLRKLVDSGRLTKDESDRYGLPGRVYDTVNSNTTGSDNE
jgi:hypothetical protein